MLQLKKGLDAIFDVVYSEDPAIDAEKSDLDAYHETGDQKHLVCKEGMQPGIFKIRGLPREIFQETQSGLAGSGKQQMDALMECIRYGVVGVDNVAVGDDPFEVKLRDSKHGKCLTDASLDAFTDFQLAIQLTQHIRRLSQVSPKHVEA